MVHISNGPYQLLKKVPTNKIKAKTLKQLKVQKKSEFIDNKLYYYLKPTELPAPRFYGQPKIHVKDEKNKAKNSTTFSNYIRNVPIEDDEKMVSLDVTSLYMNIAIIDTRNIIKDYVNDDNQFTRKTAIPQDKFLYLVHLVLTTTWYTFNSQSYQKPDGVTMEVQHPQPQEKFICRLMKLLQYLRHFTFQKFRNDLLTSFILLLNVGTWKTFCITSAIFIIILSLPWRRGVMEN